LILNWLKSKQVLPIVALFLILAMSFLYNSQPEPLVQSRQCELIDGKCELSFKQQHYTLTISPQAIVLEEELTVDFGYPENLQLVGAWVEGVNMFMGKTHILLSDVTHYQQRQTATGMLFLGSCSEANMRWRLVAEFKDDKSSQSERFYFNFSTSRD
jgi:hypothetical protein